MAHTLSYPDGGLMGYGKYGLGCWMPRPFLTEAKTTHMKLSIDPKNGVCQVTDDQQQTDNPEEGRISDVDDGGEPAALYGNEHTN